MTTAAPAPAPQPHPPITSLYTDRIITWEAFNQFLKERLSDEWGHNYMHYVRAEFLGRIAENNVRLPVRFSSDVQRIATLRPHAAFFRLLFTDWREEHGVSYENSRTSVNPDNWRVIRMMLRVYTTLPALHTNPRSDDNPLPPAPERLRYSQWLFDTHNIFPPPQHFLHANPSDAKFVRYYDEKALERDIPIRTTISKYVRRFWPETTDTALRAIADTHKRLHVDDKVLLFTSLEDMKRVYQNGVGSCMAHPDLRYGSHVYPLAVYADMPGIKLAALEGELKDDKRTYRARAFVYEASPTDKRIIRVYGDAMLQTRLLNLGYVPGNWRGAKLRKIPALRHDGRSLPNTWVMPYIDDIDRQSSSRPVQWIYSESASSEHWTVGHAHDAVTGTAAEPQNAITTGGLVGDWAEYHRFRTRYWNEIIDNDADTDVDNPVGWFATNRYGERYCRVCESVCDAEFLEPFTRSLDELTTSICQACIETNRESYFHFDSGWYNVVACAGIHRDFPDKIFVGFGFAGHKDFKRDRSLFTVFPANEMEKHGWVQLYPAYYVDAAETVVRIENAVKTSRGWCLARDLVTDVFGTREHRDACWFLGQNFAEEMQFFPDNTDLLMQEFKLGRFFILGGKLAYRANAEFRPIERRELFTALDEFTEDEADEDDALPEVLKYVPLVDFLSILGAHAVRRWEPSRSWADAWRLRRRLIHSDIVLRAASLLPRVNASLLDRVVTAFSELSTDAHAGLDGITSLGAHMHDVWQQSQRPIEEAFTRKRRAPRPLPAATFHTFVTTNTF